MPRPKMRKTVLGVTGSIAAYKACELARLFVEAGDEVKVVMTEAATKFVTPLTFRTLSRNDVFVDGFDGPDWKPVHIALAEEADLVVVAPASADFIAKMRFGLADDLLSSLLLAARAPVAIAPAMNPAMWENPAVQENVSALVARGVTLIEPGEGVLACAASGKGRMPEPSRIFEAVAGLAGGRR